MFYLKQIALGIYNCVDAVLIFLLFDKEQYATNIYEAEHWEAGGYLFITLLIEILVIRLTGISPWWFTVLIPTVAVFGFWTTIIAECEFVDKLPDCAFSEKMPKIPPP